MDAVDPLISAELAERFLVLRQLGSGGFCTVLLARDRRSGQEVAVKILRKEGDPVLFARFLQEARLLANIRHPNLVRVLELQDGERAYQVSEYVEGGSLRDKLKQMPKLSLAEAVRIMKDVLTGLQELHARGVVHRDLKPDNVLLDRKGTAKVCDLGVAKDYSRDADVRTGTGVAFLGTPAYAAPEQFDGKSGIVASDLYSSGLIFLELLTGRLPYHLSGPGVLGFLALPHPQRLASVLAGEPPALVRLLERMLAPDSSQRPASAQEVIDYLNFHGQFLGTRRTRSRWPAFLFRSSVVVLLGTAAVLMVLRSNAARREQIREDYRQRIARLFLANRCREAESVTREAINVIPDAELYINLGAAMANQGRVADALKAWEDGARRYPRDLELRGQVATAKAAMGQGTSARPRLEEYLKADRLRPGKLSPTGIQCVATWLGYTMIDAGECAEARLMIQDVLRRYPAMRQLDAVIGRSYVREKKYVKGEFFLRRAIACDPPCQLAYHDLTYLVLDQRPIESVALVAEWARRFPDDPVGVAMRVRIHDLARLVQELEADLRDGIRLQPDRVEWVNQLVDCLVDQGRAEEAEAVLRSARSRFRSNALEPSIRRVRSGRARWDTRAFWDELLMDSYEYSRIPYFVALLIHRNQLAEWQARIEGPLKPENEGLYLGFKAECARVNGRTYALPLFEKALAAKPTCEFFQRRVDLLRAQMPR